MAVDVNAEPPPASPISKRRSWMTFMPRPGSGSGRSTSGSSVARNGRPSSSSGWLGGDDHTFLSASFKRSTSGGTKVKEVVVPILAPPMEGKEMSASDSPSETPPATSTRNWTTLIPRPGSSSSRVRSSSSASRNDRPSSSSGWLGGGNSHSWGGFKRSTSGEGKVKEVVVPILAPPMEGKEMNASYSPFSETPPATSTFERRNRATFIPRPGSSSGRPTNSSLADRNGRPSSSGGWLGGGTNHTLVGFKRLTSGESKVQEVVVPILASPMEGKEMNASDSPSETPPATSTRNWTTLIPRPSSSSGRPVSSSSAGRNSRPSSSSGWLGGGGPSYTLAGFKRSASGETEAKEVVVPIHTLPIQGKEANTSDSQTPAVSTFVSLPTSSILEPGIEMSCTATYDSPSSSSRPTTPKSSSMLTFSLKSPQVLDHQASQLISNAAERTGSLKSPDQSKNSGSFGKSFTSMMGGFSSLSLSRTSTRESYVDDKERGRSVGKTKRPKSASQAPADLDRTFNRNTSRARSQSPFSLRRFRTRESSPTPQALPLGQSDAELSDTASSVLPRSTAFTDDDSGDEAAGIEAETEYGSYSDEDTFDLITERNTERNALIPHIAVDSAVAIEIEDPDPVGEGVNVIVAPEPYFPSSLNTLGSMNRGKRNPRRRKSVKTHEPLSFHTSRPVFQRDRCTITIIQGDPEDKLGTRRKRQYVVASDLSQESRYAVEWGIGTVVRDGDEMLIVTVVENESKVDPSIPNAADRATKLRSQQERQGLAYILVRQVTGLLQRTKLNVKVSCQAWHAKNARHMLLDVVDYVEPTMLIVGSRGLGQLNGILLGSISHYLIQKCSVPVMVARRRLKRPPKKSAHLSTRRAHVSLAEAGIDRVAARVDQDVQVMRDEIKKDDNRRSEKRGSRDDGRFVNVNEGDPGEEDDPEDEHDDDPIGVKVAGD